MIVLMTHATGERFMTYVWDWTFVLSVARRHGWKPTGKLARKIAELDDVPKKWESWLGECRGQEFGAEAARTLGEALLKAMRAAKRDPEALAGPDEDLFPGGVELDSLRDLAAFCRGGAFRLY